MRWELGAENQPVLVGVASDADAKESVMSWPSESDGGTAPMARAKLFVLRDQ